MFYCACDGRLRPKSIDPFGYLFWLAVKLVPTLFGYTMKRLRWWSLHVDTVVEPTRLFAVVDEDKSNQRPDVSLRDPKDLGIQTIINVH